MNRIILLLSITFTVTSSYADELHWNNPAGGPWDDPASWLNESVIDDPGTPENEQHGVPTPADIVVFDVGGSYAVAMSVATVQSVVVHDEVALSGDALACTTLSVFGRLDASVEVWTASLSVAGEFGVGTAGALVSPLPVGQLGNGEVLVGQQGVVTLTNGGTIDAIDLTCDGGIISSADGTLEVLSADLASGYVFLNPTTQPCPMGSACPHGLAVTGDLTVGAGFNVLCVLDMEYLTGTSPLLAVAGNAEFNGALLLNAMPDVMASLGTRELVPGFRTNLMTFASVQKRFRGFQSPIAFPDNIGFFGPMYTDTSLDLAIIAPIQLWPGLDLGPTTTGVVAVVNGLNGLPDAALAQQFAATLTGPGISGDWALAVLDWSHFTSNLVWPFDVLSRADVSRSAYEIGQALAFELAPLTSTLTRLHLVATSGGAWLVDGFTDRLTALNPNIQVHITFLDAFGGTSSGIDIPTVGNWTQLGDSAHWTEHYVDYRAWWDGTDVQLPHAYNIDVAGLSIGVAGLSGTCAACYASMSCFMEAHLWPWLWYGATVANPNGHLWGFGRSWEWTGQPPSYGMSPGDHTFVGVCTTGTSSTPTWQEPESVSGSVSGTTGSGTWGHPDDESVSVATTSQFDLSMDLSLGQDANRLRFALQFDSGDQGTVQLRFDDLVIFSCDRGALSQNGIDLISPSDLFVPIDGQPGAHMLRLSVDAGTEAPSGGGLAVTLSTVQFGVAEDVVLASPDVNGDGVVDVADLLALLAQWGCSAPDPCSADADGDGLVSVSDLLLLLASWSSTE